MPADARLKPTAADVMTANPRTCSTFSTVLEAVLIFRDADCSAVPVLEDGKPVGLLSDRDVALAVAEHDALASLPVSRIMQPVLVAVAPETDVDSVVDQLASQGARRALVVDPQGFPLGIVALSDLARHVADGRLIQVAAGPAAATPG